MFVCVLVVVGELFAIMNFCANFAFYKYIKQIVQFKNLQKLVPSLLSEHMDSNVIILGDVWKPPIDCREEWDVDNDVNSQIGNFVHVKDDIWPTFAKCFLSNGQPETTVIFAKDVICKLHPTSNCKHLNKQQYTNFFSKCINDNQIYYYAFNGVDDWKTEGGCVVIPQCTDDDCKCYACVEHLDLQKRPDFFKEMHLCGFDFESRVCLLSHRQMIVNSFLRTGSTKPVYEPSESVD